MQHEINAILESGAAAKKYNSQDFTKIYCIESVKNILQNDLHIRTFFVIYYAMAGQLKRAIEWDSSSNEALQILVHRHSKLLCLL